MAKTNSRNNEITNILKNIYKLAGVTSVYLKWKLIWPEYDRETGIEMAAGSVRAPISKKAARNGTLESID